MKRTMRIIIHIQDLEKLDIKSIVQLLVRLNMVNIILKKR